MLYLLILCGRLIDISPKQVLSGMRSITPNQPHYCVFPVTLSDSPALNSSSTNTQPTLSYLSTPSQEDNTKAMVPELEKARVTELHVRMDCRGCVQKIKRALHSLDGVYSMNIDLASQKLTVVSTAEPEAIVKAIKKARKFATVCSPTEPAGEAAGGAAEPAAPPPPAAAEPPANQPPAEAETPPKEEAPPSQGQDESTKAAAPAEAVPGETKEVAEIIPVVHHYPYDRASNYYYYNDHCYPCPRRYEPPDYAYSGYSHYRTSPYALPQRVRFIQDAAGAGDDYSYGGNYRRGGGGEVCVFSEDNPNACTIV